MGCRSSESGSILREQAGVMLALCLLLVGSVACRTNPLQPRKTPLTDPVAATPAANVSVATPTRVQAPPSPAPIGARTPELPGTATPLGAPLVDLPHVVADFLAAATPAPAIAAYDRATLKLLRLFYMPPGVVLQLEPESERNTGSHPMPSGSGRATRGPSVPSPFRHRAGARSRSTPCGIWS